MLDGLKKVAMLIVHLLTTDGFAQGFLVPV